MALFGPMLIADGKGDSGEETLKNAIRVSLHSKNVLLQVRLLVDIYHFYSHRGLHQALDVTCGKYQKKLGVIRKRRMQALADAATTAQVLAWTHD